LATDWKEDLLGQHFSAADGVPFKLNAAKPLTGEITTGPNNCYIDGQPCSPVGVAAGQARLEVAIFGTIGGEEKLLGEASEEYVVSPDAEHTVKFSITLDKALNKQTVTALRLRTYSGGAAVGHGEIVLDDPASFLILPALVLKR
jgi:hypothetical protein